MSRKPRFPTAWTMRDGREILIRDMANTHLQNTIAMLRRNGYISVAEWRAKEPMSPFGVVQGEFAMEAAEEAFGFEMDEWLKLRPSPHIDAMQAELNYRQKHNIILFDEDTSE